MGYWQSFLDENIGWKTSILIHQRVVLALQWLLGGTTYKGCWQLMKLSNGGLYFYPNACEPFRMPHRSRNEELVLHPESIGICATAMALNGLSSDLAKEFDSDRQLERSIGRLRSFVEQHPDMALILRILD